MEVLTEARLMYKDSFNELWNKTVNTVMYGIVAKDIKGKSQINEYLRSTIWNQAWGNKKDVPPERKLINDLSKADPKKASEIDVILSNVTISYGWGLYVGIATVIAGIIILIAVPGIWRIIGGAIALVGIGVALVAILQCRLNPKKAASIAMDRAKIKCNNILS